MYYYYLNDIASSIFPSAVQLLLFCDSNEESTRENELSSFVFAILNERKSEFGTYSKLKFLMTAI